MEKLSIDEVIAHCNRHTERMEKMSSRERLEETPIGNSERMKQYWEHRQVAKWLEELKVYKDAEEQGLLLRLPISEDTPVYSIEYCCGKNKENTSGMCFRGFCEDCNEKSYYIREGKAKQCNISEINKTVFLTSAEAERELAEKVS